MKVDYGTLETAAAALNTAASVVSSESAVPAELGAGASGPDGGHTVAVTERGTTATAMRELMVAQSRACTELIALFRLFDAQIASQIPGA